jgi:NAD-dependent SIR2 family protein deacetylase
MTMECTIHADVLSAMLPQQECENCGAMVNDGQLAHNADTGITECDNCAGYPSESEQHGDTMYPAEELKR